MLAITYLLAVAALFLDSMKIRKVRRAYQDQMERKSKDARALEKAAKAAEKAAKAAEREAAEAAKNAPVEEEPKKRGLFGSGFRLSKAEKEKAGQKAESADEAAKQDAKGTK